MIYVKGGEKLPKAYYGSQISDNMTKTPEGFLICHNVPIARTGIYKYLASEIGMDGDSIVDVYREPEEVFDQRTLASFEGKAFTDTHPLVDVDTNNWSMLSKGEITNVRIGKGENSDKIVADILVRDPIVINEIESGAKREVSAGYTCEYVERDGKVFQTKIRGNHVALVQEGRAGKAVCIKDEKIKNNKNSKLKLAQAKIII